MNVNKKGRSYHLGKALDLDLSRVILEHCLKNGGDPAHSFLPITFESVARIFSVTANTVAKIWKNFCFKERADEPLPKGGNYNRKLSDGNLELIELLKTTKSSIQLNEIFSILDEVGEVDDNSISSISRAIKSKPLSGKRYTRKRITHLARERFNSYLRQLIHRI